MHKRGLSDIVTVILVILLVLGAVVIVWALIRPVLINTSENINADQFLISYEINPSLFFFRDESRNNNKSIRLTVTNKAGGESIRGYNVLIYDSKGNIGSVKFIGDNAARKTYESKTHTIDFEGLGLIDIVKISINPIILSEEGIFSSKKEITSSINFNAPQSREIMEKLVTDALGDSSKCNNPIGQLDPGEQCDGNDHNSKTCTNFVGYTGGTLSCKDTCGFDLSQCNNNVVYICGNGVRDPGEQCDGTDLGGSTCQNINLGFDGGTLSCKPSLCEFELSSCTNEPVMETGLTGKYYQYTGSTPPADPFTTAPILTRIDQNVNFNYGSGSPHPSIASNSFSIRWEGDVIPPISDNYVFHTYSNDGMRVYVNDMVTPIVSDWGNHAVQYKDSAPIALQAGVSYPIKIEYYEGTSSAEVYAKWTYTGHVKEIIPQSAFRTPPL